VVINKDELGAYFKAIGAKGGKKAGRQMTKAERTARAKKGAAARWASKKGDTK
jgi:hypothetical protein